MHTTYHLTHVSVEVSVTSWPRRTSMSKTFGALNARSVPNIYTNKGLNICRCFVVLTVCDVPYSHLDICMYRWQCAMYCIPVWIYADVLYNVLNSHFNNEYMQMYCPMYSMYIWIYANVLCRILGIEHPALPLIYSKCHSCHCLTEDWSHTWP